MKVLLVASRDPGGRRTGRKAVLETIVRSLVSLGHVVEVAALSPRPLESPPWGELAPVHRVSPPGPASVLRNVVLRAPRGRLSLNECLFYSHRTARQVRDLADRIGADLVVADMIRTWELAVGTGRPVILDLDDLLSERYAAQAGSGPEAGDVLGYAKEYLPGPLASPLASLATRALAVEARLVAKRELHAVRSSAVTCVVSPDEAARLSSGAGRPVEWAPMAVGLASTPPDPRRDVNPVFIGGLDYAANRMAVAWYRNHVLPQLAALGAATVVLDVIGHCPDEVTRELSSPGIRFLGYVPDLEAELHGRRLAVVPVVSGTGIKTKVLEAMGAGLAVVSTPLGISGIPLDAGRDAYVGETPRQFAAVLAAAWADVDGSLEVGRRAREVVARHFSAAALTERWSRVLARAAAAPTPPLRVLFANDYDMELALQAWRDGKYPGQHLFGMAHAPAHHVQVEILPFSRLPRLKALTARRLGDLDQQLRILARRGRYDVLYSGSQYDTMALAVLRRLRLYRKPMVVTMHHLASGPLAHPRVYRFVFGAHDRLLCMSGDIYAQAVVEMGLPADQVELVEWAVDLDFYRPAPPAEDDGAPGFVMAAGKTKRDYQLLADAARGGPHRVKIYCSAASAPRLGPGRDQVEIHADSRRPNESEAVSMAELLEQYRRSRAVAIPLLATETRGTTGLTSLLEALAMARPVIMTQNTFMDLDRLGVGISVAPGDLEGWRAALASVFDDPGRAAEMGRRARALVEERYSLERYSARIAGVLHEVAGRPFPAAEVGG